MRLYNYAVRVIGSRRRHKFNVESEHKVPNEGILPTIIHDASSSGIKFECYVDVDKDLADDDRRSPARWNFTLSSHELASAGPNASIANDASLQRSEIKITAGLMVYKHRNRPKFHSPPSACPSELEPHKISPQSVLILSTHIHRPPA